MASNNENNAVHASGNQHEPAYPVHSSDLSVQRRSGEFDAHLLTTCLSKSFSNPKKHPSASNLPQHPDLTTHGPSLSEVSNGAESHPQKRSRGTEWPLKPPDEANARSNTPRRTRKPPLSPGQRHNLAIKPRPSKFLEGSMNDRTSAKPPSIYIREEDAMERYHQPASTPRLDSSGSTDLQDDKDYCGAGIETTKPSGMYRFGKALASAFNPVNVWQGINGIWKDKEQQPVPEKSLLQARKAKAEKAYAELKQSGFKGTHPFSTRAANNGYTHLANPSSQSGTTDPSLRHSIESTNRPCTPAILKHGRPTPASSGEFLIPPTTTEPRPPPPSPASQEKHGRKISMELRRPSFQSIKRVKSSIQLPSTKRKLPEALISPGEDAVPEQNNARQLKRQPSKKEIAKQRKLSKQVSDLEGKLAVARRELQLCSSEMAEVPKIPASGRKPFRPGALPSVLSESNMKSTESTTQEDSDSDRQPSPARKKRIQSSTPRKPITHPLALNDTAATKQHQPTTQSPVVTGSGRKRKSSGDGTSDTSYKPAEQTSRESDSDVSLSAKKTPRARKSQKLGGLSASQSKEPVSREPRASVTKGVLDGSSKKPVPLASPLLTPAGPFDPAKVDKNKLLAMRSVPKENLPFGAHLDDIVNLQKEFPHCSQKELDKYLASLSHDHRSKAELSGNGGQKSVEPLRAQPSSSFPTKATERHDVPFDTRQACKDQPPNKKLGRDLSTIDEAVTADPSKDKSVPPMPTSFLKKTQVSFDSDRPKVKHTNKPLPNIQKENYDWPEDVF
ncbi:MAG: hypothetical protein Q9208_008422 [Pyrenodesmia sp. 3 TL-2023]